VDAVIAAIARPRVIAHAHRGEHGDAHALPGADARASDAHRGAHDGQHHPAPHRIVPSPLVALVAGGRGGHDGRAGGHAPDPARVGAKAASLAWLASHGVEVPPAVAVPADVAHAVAHGDPLATELLGSALRRWLDPEARYAVRSSAHGEDGEVRSFAGQFETRLDVTAAEVLDAVREIAEPDPTRVAAYAARTGAVVPEQISVVIQAMVAATEAGVAFSRNPLTGLDEVVVEAVPARGDVLVGDGVTPDRWVRRWGAFSEAPLAPRVDEAVVEHVARETARLAAAGGRPVDLEWAHDGHTTWWLQARPLTGLDGLRIYSRRIARDVLPGVIKPLVWSVNVPLVNAAWLELLEELVGPLDLRPEDLARSFGYRAYFDMTAIGSVFEALGMPRDSLELLLGLPKGPESPRMRPGSDVVRHLPRVAGAGRRTLRRGRWARTELRELRSAREALTGVDPATLDLPALVRRIDDITTLGRRAAYANIVVPLTMHGYDRALGAQLRAAGLDPHAADPAADRSDRAAFSPSSALDALASLAAELSPEASAALAAERMAAVRTDPALARFRAPLEAYLARFGHLSDSANDLSQATWREDPDHVIDLVLGHRDRLEQSGGTDLEAVLRSVPAVRRPLVRLLWRRAGAFRVYRDAVGTAWAQVYGLFRPTFLAIGDRLVERGALDGRDDVMYLHVDEIRALASGATPAGGEARSLVAHRRAEVAEAADFVVPDIVYGDAFVARRAGGAIGARLTGIPTSRGSVRGTARVIRGSADFGRVEPGDVIVIPFSDVAWTPLFARAGGVVAEAGGILSHSSVVAREYGIPCIVSVPDACASVPDGATVILDGMAGTVLVEDPGVGDATAAAVARDPG
jgi:pyruvate,water dikinase